MPARSWMAARSRAARASQALAAADAGNFLAASGDLIQTGATGTNVMDLMLGLRA
jgi:glycerate 2-kinase